MAPPPLRRAARALLLAILLSAAAPAALAQDSSAAAAAIPPSSTTALSSVPGCGGAALEPTMDSCLVENTIRRGEVHEFTFKVPERLAERPFSVLLTSKSIGGVVEMIAMGPDAMYSQKLIFQLYGESSGNTAMSEGFIRIHGYDLAPGTWRVRIFGKATDRKAVLYSLRVQTPLTATRLVAPEKTALAQIVSDCCSIKKAMELRADNVDLCARILPAAAAPKTNATTDLCQVGPFMCTEEGRLQKLMLGGAGISCTAFPEAIGRFEDLHTIELEVARFGGDSVANAAKVLSNLPFLERIYFRYTDLTGPIPCDLIEGKPQLKILDFSDTPVSGELPDCVLASPALEELYLTRTSLTGPLPDTIPEDSRLRVIYSWNVDINSGLPWTDGVFSGPVPQTLSNAKKLTDLVLNRHQLTGSLPKLADSVYWLDFKGNRLDRMPATLPSDLRILDLSDNGASGPLPPIGSTGVLWVNLTSNRISGPLPATFDAAADSLLVFAAGNNSITGDLDATKWSFEYLEMLDLSRNRLGGVLPGSLAAMPSLAYLNLASNQIGGTLDEFASALPTAKTNRRRRRLASLLRRRLLGFGRRPLAADEPADAATEVMLNAPAPPPVALPPAGPAVRDLPAPDAPVAAPEPAPAKAPAKAADKPPAKPADKPASKPVDKPVDKGPQKGPDKAAVAAKGTQDAENAAKAVMNGDSNVALKPNAKDRVDAKKGGDDTPTLEEQKAQEAAAGRRGSQLTYLALSDNLFEGPIPDALQRLGVFHWVQSGPAESQLYHYLFLDNNNLWTEIPGYMLEAVSIPAPVNPCRCDAYINISNNTRFCPTAGTVANLAPGVLKTLITESNIGISCLRSDFSVVPLRDYLADPDGYNRQIPPAPPIKRAAGGGGGRHRRPRRCRRDCGAALVCRAARVAGAPRAAVHEERRPGRRPRAGAAAAALAERRGDGGVPGRLGAVRVRRRQRDGRGRARRARRDRRLNRGGRICGFERAPGTPLYPFF